MNKFADDKALKIGHMFYFGQKVSLEEKLKLATDYYIRKVERIPEFIVISDAEKFEGENFNGIDVIKKRWIMKNNFWVGEYDKE